MVRAWLGTWRWLSRTHKQSQAFHAFLWRPISVLACLHSRKAGVAVVVH